MSEPVIGLLHFSLFHFENFRKCIEDISSIPKFPAQFIAMGAKRPEEQAAKIVKPPVAQEPEKTETEAFSEVTTLEDTQILQFRMSDENLMNFFSN
jgi:hypothetical protein